MKPTKENLERLARRLGATVRYEKLNDPPGQSEIMVEAPEGHHFVSCGVHEIVNSDNGYSTMPERYAGAIEDLIEGFERCDAETCGEWRVGRCDWWGEEEVES